MGEWGCNDSSVREMKDTDLLNRTSIALIHLSIASYTTSLKKGSDSLLLPPAPSSRYTLPDSPDDQTSLTIKDASSLFERKPRSVTGGWGKDEVGGRTGGRVKEGEKEEGGSVVSSVHLAFVLTVHQNTMLIYKYLMANEQYDKEKKSASRPFIDKRTSETSWRRTTSGPISAILPPLGNNDRDRDRGRDRDRDRDDEKVPEWMMDEPVEKEKKKAGGSEGDKGVDEIALYKQAMREREERMKEDLIRGGLHRLKTCELDANCELTVGGASAPRELVAPPPGLFSSSSLTQPAKKDPSTSKNNLLANLFPNANIQNDQPQPETSISSFLKPGAKTRQAQEVGDVVPNGGGGGQAVGGGRGSRFAKFFDPNAAAAGVGGGSTSPADVVGGGGRNGIITSPEPIVQRGVSNVFAPPAPPPPPPPGMVSPGGNEPMSDKIQGLKALLGIQKGAGGQGAGGSVTPPSAMLNGLGQVGGAGSPGSVPPQFSGKQQQAPHSQPQSQSQALPVEQFAGFGSAPPNQGQGQASSAGGAGSTDQMSRLLGMLKTSGPAKSPSESNPPSQGHSPLPPPPAIPASRPVHAEAGGSPTGSRFLSAMLSGDKGNKSVSPLPVAMQTSPVEQKHQSRPPMDISPQQNHQNMHVPNFPSGPPHSPPGMMPMTGGREPSQNYMDRFPHPGYQQQPPPPQHHQGHKGQPDYQNPNGMQGPLPQLSPVDHNPGYMNMQMRPPGMEYRPMGMPPQMANITPAMQQQQQFWHLAGDLGATHRGITATGAPLPPMPPFPQAMPPPPHNYGGFRPGNMPPGMPMHMPPNGYNNGPGMPIPGGGPMMRPDMLSNDLMALLQNRPRA